MSACHFDFNYFLWNGMFRGHTWCHLYCFITCVPIYVAMFSYSFRVRIPFEKCTDCWTVQGTEVSSGHNAFCSCPLAKLIRIPNTKKNYFAMCFTDSAKGSFVAIAELSTSRSVVPARLARLSIGLNYSHREMRSAGATRTSTTEACATAKKHIFRYLAQSPLSRVLRATRCAWWRAARRFKYFKSGDV